MTAIIKVIWYLTMFLLVGLIFYAYIDLPENMVVAHNGDGFPERYLNKGTYFYTAMGAVLIFNLTLLGIGSLYSNLPPRFVIVPQKQFWLQDQLHLNKLRVIFKRWSYLMAVVVNICLLAMHVLIWSLNIGQGGKNDYFQVLFYIMIALIVFVIISLVWRLNTKKLNIGDLPD